MDVTWIRQAGSTGKFHAWNDEFEETGCGVEVPSDIEEVADPVDAACKRCMSLVESVDEAAAPEAAPEQSGTDPTDPEDGYDLDVVYQGPGQVRHVTRGRIVGERALDGTYCVECAPLIKGQKPIQLAGVVQDDSLQIIPSMR